MLHPKSVLYLETSKRIMRVLPSYCWTEDKWTRSVPQQFILNRARLRVGCHMCDIVFKLFFQMWKDVQEDVVYVPMFIFNV